MGLSLPDGSHRSGARSRGSGMARARLSPDRKSHHHFPRASRRTHHLHGYGVCSGREPAHPGRSGHAGRRSPLRDVPFRRHLHTDHGPLGQLPHSASPRHVAQRLLHLFHRPGTRRPLADRPRRRLPVRLPLPGPHADQHPRAHRQRHPRLPQARHRRRHRLLHRLHRDAQRQNHSSQSRHLRRHRQRSPTPRFSWPPSA